MAPRILRPTALVGKTKSLVCVIAGCGRPTNGRTELCSTHYSRLRSGKPLDTPITSHLPKGQTKPCSVVGCDRDAVAKGMCNRHLHRSKRGSSLSVPPRVRNVGKSCSVINCSALAKTKGLCVNHYARSLRWSCDDPRNANQFRGQEAKTFGIHTISGGYVSVYVPPNTPGSRKAYNGEKYASWFMLEHRYVMQQHLGRPLSIKEQVHHRDGNRSNNHIDNLELKSGAHGSGINIIDGVYASLDWLARYAGLDMVERSALASIREKADNGLLGDQLPIVSRIDIAKSAKRAKKAAEEKLL